MDSERRYDDVEARRIFVVATGDDASETSSLAADRGLTLAELQDIAAEAGIHPTRVADAARLIEASPAPLPRQTSLGMQVSAGQLISLPRRPNEVEWSTLVARFRDVFEATGEVRSDGDARVWANGALKVLLEPTVDGYQLRLTTVNRRFRSLGRIGVVLAIWGLTYLAILAPEAAAAGGGLLEVLIGLLPSLIVLLGGLGFVGYSALSLPAWVAERQAQFAGLGDEALKLLDTPVDDDSNA